MKIAHHNERSLVKTVKDAITHASEVVAAAELACVCRPEGPLSTSTCSAGEAALALVGLGSNQPISPIVSAGGKQEEAPPTSGANITTNKPTMPAMDMVPASTDIPKMISLLGGGSCIAEVSETVLRRLTALSQASGNAVGDIVRAGGIPVIEKTLCSLPPHNMSSSVLEAAVELLHRLKRWQTTSSPPSTAVPTPDQMQHPTISAPWFSPRLTSSQAPQFCWSPSMSVSTGLWGDPRPISNPSASNIAPGPWTGLLPPSIHGLQIRADNVDSGYQAARMTEAMLSASYSASPTTPTFTLVGWTGQGSPRPMTSEPYYMADHHREGSMDLSPALMLPMQMWYPSMSMANTLPISKRRRIVNAAQT